MVTKKDIKVVTHPCYYLITLGAKQESYSRGRGFTKADAVAEFLEECRAEGIDKPTAAKAHAGVGDADL